MGEPGHSAISNTHHSLGRLPLHVQISEMLVREIKAGRLLHGEKLRPERQLANDFGIAVGTLRRALSDLEEKGYLRRVQGSGNYVQDTDDGDNIYAFFHLELIEGGGLPTAHALSVDLLPLPDELFLPGESGAAFRIRRLRYINDVAAAIEEIWLDGTCADSIHKDEVQDSMYYLYHQKLGIAISRATDSVSVATPPSWAPADFGDHSRETWGFIERRSANQAGKDIEYSRTWFDPSTTRYVARWR